MHGGRDGAAGGDALQQVLPDGARRPAPRAAVHVCGGIGGRGALPVHREAAVIAAVSGSIHLADPS